MNTSPQVGEIYVKDSEDGNPFINPQRAKILDVRSGWVKYLITLDDGAFLPESKFSSDRISNFLLRYHLQPVATP